MCKFHRILFVVRKAQYNRHHCFQLYEYMFIYHPFQSFYIQIQLWYIHTYITYLVAANVYTSLTCMLCTSIVPILYIDIQKYMQVSTTCNVHIKTAITKSLYAHIADLVVTQLLVLTYMSCFHHIFFYVYITCTTYVCVCVVQCTKGCGRLIYKQVAKMPYPIPHYGIIINIMHHNVICLYLRYNQHR